MVKLTTSVCLRLLLTSDNYLLTWLKAGYTKADRSRYRYRFEQGMLSLEKQDELLERCGFTVGDVKTWHKPVQF